MTNAASRRWLLVSLVAVAMTLIQQARPRAQVPEGTDLSIELVDPKVLRVCADPRNLPFSNEKGEGFENKLAQLFAEKLQKKLDYMYFPQATGFVKMTLGAHRCDVIMGRATISRRAPIPTIARPMRWSPSRVAALTTSPRSKTNVSRANVSASSPARRRPPTWRSPG